jgi:hypothetical protein
MHNLGSQRCSSVTKTLQIVPWIVQALDDSLIAQVLVDLGLDQTLLLVVENSSHVQPEAPGLSKRRVRLVRYARATTPTHHPTQDKVHIE